jgi:hypothetical protein
VTFVKSGTDSGGYSTDDSIDLTIYGGHGVKPAFESVSYAVTRKTATFTVTKPNAVGTIYFQVELMYIDAPTPTEIVDSFADGKSLRVNTGKEGETVTFTVTNLAAETYYVLFLTL